jgi:hypothetical protein
MNKKNNLDSELLGSLDSIRKNQESLPEEARVALNALDLASKVMNTIMLGNQIDPVFFKKMVDDINKNIAVEKLEVKRILKKKKLKIKS